MHVPRTALHALAVLALLASGCKMATPSQQAAVQSQNRMLTEQSRAQLAEIENLKIHSRSIEDRLIQAEQELARVEQGGKRLAGGTLPGGVNGQLAELASRHGCLQYDPQSGASKLDTDLLFDSGETELKPGADRLLQEFAEIFQSPEARDLKIMVVGHADARAIKGRQVRERYPTNWHLSAGRALVVADRLRQAGIPEERMGVTGFAQHQPISPNDSAQDRQKNRRVQIFVLGPETPVVGWSDSANKVYR